MKTKAEGSKLDHWAVTISDTEMLEWLEGRLPGVIKIITVAMLNTKRRARK